jgi:hypothetical protein
MADGVAILVATQLASHRAVAILSVVDVPVAAAFLE